MHNKARCIRFEIQDLFEASIHHDAFVEDLVVGLLANVDSIFELLTLENSVSMEKKMFQDAPSISIGNDDRHLVTRNTRARRIRTTVLNFGMKRRVDVEGECLGRGWNRNRATQIRWYRGTIVEPVTGMVRDDTLHGLHKGLIGIFERSR